MAGSLSQRVIVEAARPEVERGGFESLSMRGLARQLGVTAPAFYEHIDSKATLLALVAAEGYRELIEELDAVDAPIASDRLAERSAAYVRFAGRHPELFRLMFQYRPENVPIEADNVLPAAGDAYDLGRGDIAEAMDRGEIRRGDVDEITLMVWAAIHGVATLAAMAPGAAPDPLATNIVRTLVAGMAP